MVYLIRQITGYNPSFVDHERFERDSPFRSLGQPNGRPVDLEGLYTMQTELIMPVHGFIRARYFLSCNCEIDARKFYIVISWNSDCMLFF